MIILSRNECPYSPSPRVIEYLYKYTNGINRYEIPGLYEELVSKIAEYNSTDTRHIELFLGSEEFFTLLPWFMIRNSLKFIYFNPTFTPVIEDLSPWSIELVELELDENFNIRVDEALEKCSEKTIVYIIRPNNPTGNIPISCRDIGELARRSRLVIVDEAYYEFSRQTCIDLISELENIVILRTLSKAFCIAGARLGYMISSPGVIREITSIRRKYSIPVTTILTGLGALSDLDYMKKTVDQILSIKEYTVKELLKIRGVEVKNTLTNFILVGRENYDSKTLYERLLENGIVVKQLDGRLSKYVRVSIGTLSEMRVFIDTMKKI